MRLGAHESTAGGLHRAFERAAADGADALQLFVKSGRMWRARPLEPGEAEAFRAAHAAAGIPAFAHGSYLLNLAAEPGTEVREKSIAGLADELARCELLGLPGLVVHPGANADAARGIALAGEAIARALEAVPGQAAVWIENTAGQGSSLGWELDHLARILDAAGGGSRLGICFDTCHAFAAGHDLTTPAGYRQTFRRLEESLGGLARVKAFHLNDCKKPLGCRVDRHEDVGDGAMGLAPFRLLLEDDRFAAVPGVLETPVPERYAELLARLRGLVPSETGPKPARRSGDRRSPSARPRTPGAGSR
jgi:deoxyribonuclease-4